MNSSYVVQFEGVRFSWLPRSEPLLEVGSLSIAPGEKVLLRGPSGSGKSTFLGLVSGVISPTEGKISVLGEDFGKKSPIARDKVRADHMGYIFQLFNLLPYLTAEENILLALGFSQRKKEILRARNVSPKEEALRLLSALGLDAEEISQRKANKLSVGQQQRVAVARALMGEPELLLADEPTSALDTEAREAFLKLMIAECDRSKTALIYVSHDASLAIDFDRTLEISNLRSKN